ncbi:MAG TPA: hypothetical protein VLA13_08780, partial [Massilibacterium sp.]|nr:hypothetical protein [Massilibacterium sp.]
EQENALKSILENELKESPHSLSSCMIKELGLIEAFSKSSYVESVKEDVLEVAARYDINLTDEQVNQVTQLFISEFLIDEQDELILRIIDNLKK